METNKISTKQSLQLKDATAYLEALVASFRAGKIVVEKDGDFLTMIPAEHVEIEISAKTKKGKGKFSMELSWVEPEGGPLTISDTEPESVEKNGEAAPEEAAHVAPGAELADSAAADANATREKVSDVPEPAAKPKPKATKSSAPKAAASRKAGAGKGTAKKTSGSSTTKTK